MQALQRHSAEARTNSCLLLLLSSPCPQNILCEWTGYSIPDWQLTCFIYFIFNTEQRLVFTNVNRRALQSTENSQPALNQNSGNSKYPSPVILTGLSFKRGTPPCAWKVLYYYIDKVLWTTALHQEKATCKKKNVVKQHQHILLFHFWINA